MVKLVFLEEARQARRPLMLSFLTYEDKRRLAETVLAFWPIVEAVASWLCMLSDASGENPEYHCGECITCQARKLVEEKT